MVENAVHVATSQHVARSMLFTPHVAPVQYDDAGSEKLTTDVPASKPGLHANSEHAKSPAPSVHWAEELAPTVSVFVCSGQVVQAPIVPVEALYEWTGHGWHGVVALLS